MENEALIRELKDELQNLASLVCRLEEEITPSLKESAIDKLRRMTDENLLLIWWALQQNRWKQQELKKICTAFLEDRGYQKVIEE